MRVTRILCLALVFLVSFSSFQLIGQTSYNQQWPGFRGPFACGYIEGSKTAVTWNVENSKNIKWKTSIPGMGHSSPVIWDDKVFVTTASNEKSDESLKVGLYGDIGMLMTAASMNLKFIAWIKIPAKYFGKK